MIIEQTINKQKGAVLAVSLILLVLITILGVNGIQNASLEEKMTTNTYDRNIAFQAAEASLRQAELYITENTVAVPVIVEADTDNTCPASSINNCDTATGVCALPDKDCTNRWEAPAFTGWVNSNSNMDLALSGADPQYFIEYLGSGFTCIGSSAENCKRFRITAKSHPGADRSTVVLQSIFQK